MNRECLAFKYFIGRRVLEALEDHGPLTPGEVYAIIHLGTVEDEAEKATPLLYEGLVYLLARATPRVLLNAFPPTKAFDGERFQCKDYFYTMEVLEAHGLDKPLGAKVIELLWDYVNPWVRRFVVALTNATDRARQEQGRRSALEEYLGRQGRRGRHGKVLRMGRSMN